MDATSTTTERRMIMGDTMTFPATVEEFMEQYKMTDTEHVYSNGTEYVPIYRMKQWFEHCRNQQRPPIDAVSVVRCRECSHGRPCVDGYVRCSHPSGKSILMKSSDFCSYGKRKEGSD